MDGALYEAWKCMGELQSTMVNSELPTFLFP
jgi:hypothetical protein